MTISELFNVKYGINLELVNCEETTKDDPEGIAFVARTEKNNGVVGYVKPIDGKKPQKAGLITCASGGSTLSTFVQDREFYSGRDLYILEPKTTMSLNEKLFWCMCIHTNAYKYNYGRQANKTLGNLDLPDKVPDYVGKIKINPITTKNIPKEKKQIEYSSFKIADIFEVKKGKRLVKEDMIEGDINYLGAINDNNGVRQKISAEEKEIRCGNCITVNYNGSVGQAFYQQEPFWASDDVNILYAKGWELNKYIALYICTVIKANSYKFGYGRKWTKEKMEETNLRLPARNGEPDYNYMERYIKELPYADRI